MKNNQALIENFLEAKFGEEGLSENTILAYSRDLEQICKKVGKSLVDVSQSDLEQYFIYLKNSGHSKSTTCLLYTSPSPRDATLSRMPSSA